MATRSSARRRGEISAFAGSIALVVASAAGFGACASGGAAAPGGTANAGGGGGSGGFFSIASTSDQASSSTSLTPDASCAAIGETATSIPLNLFIAFDKSSSMAGNKWTSAKAGLATFVTDPASAGISAALDFFPIGGTPSCDQTLYETPVVAFGPLPANGATIDTTMDATTPDGFTTPIYPALGGAVLAVKSILDNNAGQAGAVLLVTDGQPMGPASMCGGVDPQDPQAIAALAAAGHGFGVRTFVIGLPGVDQTTANAVAQAGGTGTSILVSAVDVQKEFEDALAQVRGNALPCEYQIPAKVKGGEIDDNHVNVSVTPSGKMETELAQDPSCQGAGWKYDDAQNPKYIVLCPTSCDALRTDFGAQVQILLGCKTEVIK